MFNKFIAVILSFVIIACLCNLNTLALESGNAKKEVTVYSDSFEHLNTGSVKVGITNSTELFTKSGDTYKPFLTAPAPSGDKWGMFTNFSSPTHKLVNGEYVAIDSSLRKGSYCGDTFFEIKAIKGGYKHTYYTDYNANTANLSTVTVTPRTSNVMIGLGQLFRTNIKAIENLTPNTEYTLSFWVYQTNSSGFISTVAVADNYEGLQSTKLSPFSSDCKVLGGAKYSDTTATYGKWTELKVNFTTNEKTTAYLHISLNGLGTDGNKSMVFLDDLLVTTLVEDTADDTEESLLAGDVNGDKITNLKDLIILAQYLAKWQNVTVDTNLADVNADGETDMGDLNNLARYLAGWKNVAVKGDGYMNFAPAEHSLKDIKSNLKFNSRATFIENKLRMEWSASGFTVQGQFRGDFVLTDIQTSKEVLLYAVLDNDYDNPKQLRIKSGNLTALTNIEPGFHTIQILKATEASAGVIAIGGISYTGALFTAPAEKDLKIQFIGDSITSASGLYTATVQPDSLLRNDITKGYAYKVAKHFNAELSIVSVSGGTICTNSPSLQDYYQRTLYTSSTSVYDFSAETKPDLVVVALGTNDTPTYLTKDENGKTVTADNVGVLKQGIIDMLTLVRKNNPDAAILWAYGMMEQRISSVYKTTVEEFAATDGNTFYTLIGRNDCTGSGGHPTPNGHTLNANEYITFIEGNIW